MEGQVLSLINQARAVSRACGATTYPAVAPLTLNGKLNLASYRHAFDMATNNYFSHTSLDGSTPWQRLARVGYTYRSASENIAAGYSTPAAVVAGWLKSEGHCRNIMSPNVRELGVGYAYTTTSNFKSYWVTMFGTPTTN